MRREGRVAQELKPTWLAASKAHQRVKTPNPAQTPTAAELATLTEGPRLARINVYPRDGPIPSLVIVAHRLQRCAGTPELHDEMVHPTDLGQHDLVDIDPVGEAVGAGGSDVDGSAG